MTLKERAREYLITNWGAPFVLAFIVLLITSAAFLTTGAQDLANSIAVYAFYALVLGVVLQIASYVKYGEGGRKPPEISAAPPKPRLQIKRRYLAIIVVLLIVLGGVAATFYYFPSIGTSTTPKTVGKLKVGVNFIQATPGPGGSEQVIFGINNTGGIQPFNFTAHWADGYNESNDVGVFQRSFTYNQSVPATVLVVVKSSDGEVANVTVHIPSVSRSTTTLTSVATSQTRNTTSAIGHYAVTFVESGLQKGQSWTVSFGPLSNTSDSNIIMFSLPSGYYSYTVSEPYASNYSWAAIAQPESGLLVVNHSAVRENISYTVVKVSTPQDRLFNLTGGPFITSLNGQTALNITYTNNFPIRLTGIVVVMVRNSTTGVLVQLQSATIAPAGGENQSVLILLNGIAPGNYSASISVQSSSGAMLSQISTKTISVT
ncbi:MAG: hypothetical protein JRN52_13470 [Nitrososphaerota archaeon]|nr:hypothetical protein [Nitrososphaerota archaeon]